LDVEAVVEEEAVEAVVRGRGSGVESACDSLNSTT
jgi:hypothetical protein